MIKNKNYLYKGKEIKNTNNLIYSFKELNILYCFNLIHILSIPIIVMLLCMYFYIFCYRNNNENGMDNNNKENLLLLKKIEIFLYFVYKIYASYISFLKDAQYMPYVITSNLK